MKEVYPLPIPSQIDAGEQQRFSRRAFVGGGAGLVLAGGGVLGGLGAREYLFQPEDYHAVDAYLQARGFPKTSIGRERFNELVPNYYNTLLSTGEHNLDINIVNEPDVLAEVSFNLPKDELVYVTIKTNPQGNLQVVEAQHNGQESEIGILETGINSQGKFSLGEISGEQYLRLMRTSAGKDVKIDSITVHALQGDPLFKTIMRCSPTMGMRLDNYQRFLRALTDEEQAEALTNDMLLALPVEIRENDKEQLALIYWGLYSAEDGGWGKDPEKMYHRTKGHRLFDSDIAQIVITDLRSNIFETAHQEDNQSGKHQMKVDFTSPEAVAPFDLVLHSVPNHGMVGVDLEVVPNDPALIALGFESYIGQPISKVMRPTPIIDLLMPEGAVADMYWGARVNALKENIREANRALALTRQMRNVAGERQMEVRLEFLNEKLQEEYRLAA